MNQAFAETMKTVVAQCDALIASSAFKCGEPPAHLAKKRGVYLLSEGDDILYVGRTNNIRKRLQNHVRRSHNTATFAFLLARQDTGRKATYQKKGSRADLLKNDQVFSAAFDDARKRIRQMDVRIVLEDEPVRQALLEIYAASVTGAKHNDFDNH